ncbi:type II toxin-antitoxin system RelE/ParE family toxin [Methylobacterium sp. E-066]|uniref:type II toxin-antitoxin system RelE/ParE family toxin n=1 Tax=Methylobacterium sp. E-066 TaxID=2836584 RepID=UPI001FB916FD|nr:type II toxin-antitoxin system RelE/ParE family toxin [Methylobacterium sp. E-066]MCJ2141232.1 type II toxin-antitoxin system RelE/ParE family toxin [Methylobacterium sp. E-066]
MKLRFTRPALTDLAALTEYIEARSPEGARHVRRRIKDALERLADYPMLGQQTDDPTIRRLTTIPYPYLIFYEVTDAAIIVHAVRHSARDPGSMPDA